MGCNKVKNGKSPAMNVCVCVCVWGVVDVNTSLSSREIQMQVA